MKSIHAVQDGPSPPSASEPETKNNWHEITIKRGDTLSSIFSGLNIYGQLGELMALGKEAQSFRHIQPGQRIRIRIDANTLEELIFEQNKSEQLHVTRQPNGLDIIHVNKPAKSRRTVASGNIKHSLYRAALQSGLSERLIMNLIHIFSWDIDFALDIREGDSFTVLYEEFYIDGEKIKDGEIVAAEFLTRSEPFHAFRYTDAKGVTGYFSADGRRMRKAFLRMPVSFGRISSRFNLRRKHPILNKIRAHKGVDYAAPAGTSVKAAGDGKIVFRGRKGGYGKTIVLNHGGNYSTLYAHLSRYARNAKAGQRVKQGQTIGYIGKSGLATGPHLHYEFRVNGMHRNPLTVKLPSAKPLPKAELINFSSEIQPLMAELKLHRHSSVAIID
ncbi:MAG: peptidoglycan DD-metalloendopeptidase family protein [Gammaproteobacteria bacterium]|nr:peptidoglycan DD-metalloendopeptidase family protein [Gammaproteobacteria bacterium]